jgi:flagellar basal-body rod modification protein FlgD
MTDATSTTPFSFLNVNTTASTSNTSSTNSSSSSTSDSAAGTIAGNFNTFLQLLTTQLQNQNPLDPLDTNQFTQQLVQFASVEQQINMNQHLSDLVSLEQAATATVAVGYLGATVAVDGSTTQLTNSQATWTFSVPKAASATVNITDSTGQTVYSGSYTMQAGEQNFVWDGIGNDGTQWPDGNYSISVTATDASGQPVAVSTQVEGVVDSVDLSQNPPVLSIGGQNFTPSQIKRITRPGLSS